MGEYDRAIKNANNAPVGSPWNKELREKLNSEIQIVEVQAHMEDEAFAREIVRAALEIF